MSGIYKAMVKRRMAKQILQRDETVRTSRRELARQEERQRKQDAQDGLAKKAIVERVRHDKPVSSIIKAE